VRLPLRGLRVRELSASCGDPGAGGGVSMPAPHKRGPLIDVRDSSLHGLGVFAARRIGKGMRIIEYLGERITHAEADRRYEGKDACDNHTFLFIVDARTVIDAGVNGN